MTRPKRAETESFTVSFLDVASCGFGAMIILLMIVKPADSRMLEISEVPQKDSISELQEQLFEIRGETNILNRELNAKHEQLSAIDDRVARLRRDLSDIEGRYRTTQQLASEDFDELGELRIAQQRLTDEMKRLQLVAADPKNAPLGGVPVDSEYIIFVIDTSGSMQSLGNWEKVLRVVSDTLDVYPEVKGIQVMSDDGDYLFNAFRGQWMEDSPQRRRDIILRLATWTPSSDSNPVDGIQKAIREFYSEDKKVSIYVLGDDFCPLNNCSVEQALQSIDQENRNFENKERKVRIHAIGFYTVMANSAAGSGGATVDDFAALMRQMTARNGGALVLL